MQKYLLLCLFFTSCHSQLLSAATQVYKCTTSNGAVTFSDKACAASTTQDTHQLKAPMTIPALSASTIKKALSKKKKKPVRVTVVTDNDHPCGAFDPTQRRSHLVRKQVKSGMSRAEVESMFGKPLTQRSHNGKISATYRSAKNKKRSVRFDQHGCVP
ncbi:DUF4124 domain-containing protein [Pseudomonas sp. C27(2019)]|uniref:DUF4124 domain-containing protein n=1 Tax=Pseudomonas sp. C27(2019) TaxID=2604941 RepID=UPI0015B44159|nr:DUF4124 domain-containing protein [Pseudomonas sp. C27(2019)]